MERLKRIYDKANLKVCARELYIDRYTLSPFTDEHKIFLEKICEMVSTLFERSPSQ
jgi:hypothetical protein